MTITVGSLLGGGVRVLRDHPRSLAIWTVVQGLLFVGILMIALPFFGTIFRLAGVGQTASVDAIQTMLIGIAEIFAAYFVFMIWWLIMFAAIVRAARDPLDDRFGFLRIGMDELRLFVIGILFVVATFTIQIGLSMVSGIVVVLIGMGSPVAAAVISMVVNLLALAVMMLLQLRFALMGAVTVLEGRLSITASWRATAHGFWTVVLAAVLLFIVMLIIEGVIIGVLAAVFMSSYAGSGNSQQVFQAQFAALGQGLTVGWIVGAFIVGVLFGILSAYWNSIIGIAGVEMSGGPGSDLRELEARFE